MVVGSPRRSIGGRVSSVGWDRLRLDRELKVEVVEDGLPDGRDLAAFPQGAAEFLWGEAHLAGDVSLTEAGLADALAYEVPDLVRHAVMLDENGDCPTAAQINIGRNG